MKNPLTPAGIEPATFRFGTQHLNDCTTAVPKSYVILITYLGQQWLFESALVLRYTYIACLVHFHTTLQSWFLLFHGAFLFT